MKGRALEEIFVYESALTESQQLMVAAAQIVVVRAGRLITTSPSPSCSARAGEVLLVAGGTSLRGDSESAARATHFQLSPSMARRLAEFLPRAAVAFPSEQFGDAVPRMMREKRGVDASSPLAIEAAVCQIYAEARRLRSAEGGAAEPRSAAVAAAIRYAREHLAGVVTLGDLARASGMSTRGIGYRFSVELHTSPLAYVRELRVREAERLLRKSSLGLAEIARRCGFYDQAHLNRAFRAQLACTPADYRRRVRSHRAHAIYSSD
jgi:AraC-like DNA-binding protein